LSEQSQHHDATIDFASEPSADLQREFEAAWQESLKGRPEPSLTAFLARCAAASAPIIKEQLEKLDHEYRQRLNRDGLTQGDTSVVAKTGAGGSADDATIRLDHAPDTQRLEASRETGDFSAKTGEYSVRSPVTNAAVDATTNLSKAPADSQTAAAPAADANTASFTLKPPREEGPHETVYNTVAGYDILGVLGRGAMGVVYKARDRGLKRIVALKMIIGGEHADETELARFRIEAEAVAQLQHPNIVQVYEVSSHDGCPFLSLEFVDGGSLQQKLSGEPQPVLHAAQLMQLLAQAIDFAHGKGIVHRDLKPANVMLTVPQAPGSKETMTGAAALVGEFYGAPKIADFGLAKRVEEDTGATRTGAILGTPNYMSPEQAEGRSKEVGPLADQYALGAMLYELLTGRPPFRGTTVMETIEQVRKQEPVPPSRLQPSVPRDLETICLKALQKEPEKRYLTCGLFAEDLRRFVAGEPIMARPIGNAERLWRWCKRNPRVAAMTATIFVLLVAGVIGSTISAVTISRQKDEADDAKNEAIDARNQAIDAKNQAMRDKLEADNQADLALESVKMLGKIANERLRSEPGVQALRRELLQTALDGLKRVANRAGNEASRKRSMGDAFLQMGILAVQIGNSEEAYQYFERCYNLTKPAIAAEPANDRWKVLLSAACMELGMLSASAHRDMQKSLAYYQENLELRKQIASVSVEERRRQNEKLAPENRLIPFFSKLYLSEAYNRIGMTYYFMGNSKDAEPYVAQCLAVRERLIVELVAGEAAWSIGLPPTGPLTPLAVATSIPWQIKWASEQQQNLARSYHLIGEIYFRLRNLEKSRDYYAKCTAIREAALKENPKDFELRGDLAEFLSYCGNVHLSLGDPRGALPFYDRSIQLNREMVAADKNVQWVRNLAVALYGRGRATARMQDEAGAGKFFAECVHIREDLARKDPASEEKKTDLMLALPHVHRPEEAARIAEALRIGREKDQQLLIAIGQCYAQCALVATQDSARKEYVSKSLAAIQAAVGNGYNDLMTLETAPELEPVRKLPEFVKLLDRIKSKSTAVTTASR
jgi:serine/threonine protein kinase